MIIQLPIGLLNSNCYVIYDREGGEGAIVDPGFDNGEELRAKIAERRLNVRYILNTHGHFDHTAGNGCLDLPDAILAIHPADAELLAIGGGAHHFGFRPTPTPKPAMDLTEGTQIDVGKIQITVLHTPGHTPGSVCLYLPEDGAVLTGDTLFSGSVGRTDLPGGDLRAMKQSLGRLLALPPETGVYPGHGPITTIRRELSDQHNPWLHRLGLVYE